MSNTRTDLLDRLAWILADLNRAKLDFVGAIEAGDARQSQVLALEIEELRKDCHDVRAELGRFPVQLVRTASA